MDVLDGEYRCSANVTHHRPRSMDARFFIIAVTTHVLMLSSSLLRVWHVHLNHVVI